MDFPIPPTPNDGLSIEGVAARAGVGKQTVYRWWASKSALVTEAVLDGRLPISGEPPPDTGDLRTDLGAWLTRQFKGMADPYVLSLIRAVTAAAADDATAGAALYERFTGPAHEAIVARLAAGVSAGQARSGADLHAAADAIAGTLLYVALTRQDPAPERITGLLDMIMDGISHDPITTTASQGP
jgi:AcrR family transcriptional regulator